MLNSQFSSVNPLDSPYLNEFIHQFKSYDDYPEIAQSNTSTDFFVDNLSSQFFQWKTISTTSGKQLYLNKITGEQTDQNPWVNLKQTIRSQQEADQNWCWIPDPKYVWLPAKFMRKEGGLHFYQTADKSQIRIPESKAKSMVIPLDRLMLMQNTHDLMAVIEGRNEAYIMYLLANRYYSSKIYTRLTNRALISLNPYRVLPIYSEQVAEMYKENKSDITLPPHLYSLAKSAINSLIQGNKSQTIVVVGETGAGKTEACKECIKVKDSVLINDSLSAACAESAT